MTTTTTTTMDTTTMGDSDGGGCPRLFQSTARVDRVMGDSATTGAIKIERGGDENITINHSGGDDGGDDGGDGCDGGGRESDGGVGGGRSSSLSTAAATGAAKT
jgi:hypothetical protein